MTSIILKKGREKSLLRHHPWVFSGAIARVKGSPAPGDTVEVFSSQDRFLGRGAYSPRSQIVVRIWTFEESETITAEFFRTRLQRALQARSALAEQGDLTAYRLVNAESDFLPGIIIDRYDTYLLCQFLTAGAEYWKQAVVEALSDLIPSEGIYERSDADVRRKEGLALQTGVLAGRTPPETIEIQEGGLRFQIDVLQGHKTGGYLDQRDNRKALRPYVKDAEVLNCFAYTGGFGLYALQYGAAHVTNIDTSATALALAQKNITLNHFEPNRAECITDDVFKMLRRYRDSRRQFDLIILDPPKFAESRGQLQGACRGYKDINLLAFKLLRPGGTLFTFSCSGLMQPDLFQKIVADAALDAGREAQIARRLSQSSDHPVALTFPEGTYLKGLICKVL